MQSLPRKQLLHQKLVELLVCNPGIIFRQEHSLQRAALHLGRAKKLPLLRDQSIVTAGPNSWLFEKVKSR